MCAKPHTTTVLLPLTGQPTLDGTPS